MAVSSERPRRSRPNGSVAGAAAIVPASSIGCVTPLIVSSSRAFDAVVVEPAELGGPERDLGMTLRVEEVRRLEVAVELLVLHVDARDLGRALEGRRLAAREGGLEIGEAATKRLDARVRDLERDVGVDRISVPGSGGSELLRAFDCGHRGSSLLLELQLYLRCQLC